MRFCNHNLARLVAVAIALVVCSSIAHAADSEQALIERRAARVKELPAPPSPPTVGSVQHPIDRFIAAGWKKLPEPPKVKVCDDATFLRRVHLDVIGVIPTLKETNRFLAAKASAEKRRQLVDELLARDDDYAAHWTVFWEDALASQSVLEQGGVLTRGDYRQWLLSSFRRNRPYDVMVAELIDPTMPGRQSAKNKDVFGVEFSIEYVRNETYPVTLQSAANVGQVFLGTSMKCASCHDHFENSEWPQERFLAFAGLFAPADLEKIRCDKKSGQMIAAKFPFVIPGESPQAPAELHERLHQAAQLITDPANPRFAKTIVNRLWKRYFGLGLFEPADDFREDTPASHPELLEWLAHDFLAHGCDLKHTIRLILTSQTYQLRYDPALADSFDAANPKAPRYVCSPNLRRLTAEQLLDSIRLAASGELQPEQRTFLDGRSTALMRALGRPASRNEIITQRPDDVAVLQSLELLNGELLQELVSETAGHEEGRQDERRAVDRLYRAVLTRPPTTAEKNAGREFLQSAASPAEGMSDLLWVLVCSPEFQYLH
jgi:hypothetical protein